MEQKQIVRTFFKTNVVAQIIDTVQQKFNTVEFEFYEKITERKAEQLIRKEVGEGEIFGAILSHEVVEEKRAISYEAFLANSTVVAEPTAVSGNTESEGN